MKLKRKIALVTGGAATKAPIMGMTRVMGKELGKYGITVNAVDPGSIMTDMYIAAPEEAKQKKEPLFRCVAMERLKKLQT